MNVILDLSTTIQQFETVSIASNWVSTVNLFLLQYERE